MEFGTRLKRHLSIKLHSVAVSDEKYIKAKVIEFIGVIKTNFLDNKYHKKICITLALSV